MSCTAQHADRGPTHRDQQERVRRALASAVTDLFESYGFPCELFDEQGERAQAERGELGSVIGFRGNGVRGGLAFVAPFELIAKLLPVPTSPHSSDVQLRDWSGEMTNQILGRFKNKLSTRTLDFDVGIPVCFTGKAIRFVFLPDAEGLSLVFRTDSTLVRVHLDCSFAPELLGSDLTELRIVPEGDVLLF
jgi:CheY-specific phosphatase CheX